MKNRILCLAVASLVGFSIVPSAFAATAVGAMTVTATVISGCTVTGPSTLNFGLTLNPTATSDPVDATTTIGVICTATTPYTVALDAGVNAGGATNFTARSIKFGANAMDYQLYTTALRTTIWGDGTASTGTTAGTGSGLAQSLTVYGRLPSLTGAIPGVYTDTVTITITY